MKMSIILAICLPVIAGASRGEEAELIEAKQTVLTEIARREQLGLCLVSATEFERLDGYCVPEKEPEPALVVADFNADGRPDIGVLLRHEELVKKEYRRKTSWWAWWRKNTETCFVATVVPSVLLRGSDGGWVLRKLLEVETTLQVGIHMQALDAGILSSAPAALNDPSSLRSAKATPVTNVLCIRYCGKSTVAYFWDGSRRAFSSVWLSD